MCQSHSCCYLDCFSALRKVKIFPKKEAPSGFVLLYSSPKMSSYPKEGENIDFLEHGGLVSSFFVFIDYPENFFFSFSIRNEAKGGKRCFEFPFREKRNIHSTH